MEQLMNSFSKSGNLHHAYFLVGNNKQIFHELKNFLKNKIGIKTSNNPDFISLEFGTLSIDEARSIASMQDRKSLNAEGKKVFIIQANFITEEAQNSFLKVLEEPTSGTHFFIISPQDNLLPTLRSRIQIVLCQNNKSNEDSILKLDFKERMAKVKNITDAIKDEEKTKQDAIEFLNNVEIELYERGTEINTQALRICENARLSLYDRGAPVKIILENVMLSI